MIAPGSVDYQQPGFQQQQAAGNGFGNGFNNQGGFGMPPQ